MRPFAGTATLSNAACCARLFSRTFFSHENVDVMAHSDSLASGLDIDFGAGAVPRQTAMRNVKDFLGKTSSRTIRQLTDRTGERSMGQVIGSAGARCRPDSALQSPRNPRKLGAGGTNECGISTGLPAQAMYRGMTT
jgi:hypothetical protein